MEVTLLKYLTKTYILKRMDFGIFFVYSLFQGLGQLEWELLEDSIKLYQT